MDKRRVRGNYVQAVLHYINTMYGPEQRSKIMAAIDPDVVLLLPKLSPTVWYPIEHLVSVFDAIAASQPFAKTEEDIKLIGKAVATEALGTFLKLLLKILTPRLFASKFDAFWHKYHEFGEMRADLKELESSHIVLYGTAYPYMHLIATGWGECVFREALGKTDALVTADVPAGQRESATSEVAIHVRW